MNSIPVVLSTGQEAEHFITGLVEGYGIWRRLDGVAILVVKDDQILVQKQFGDIRPETPLSIGFLRDLFTAIAAMQFIERGLLVSEDDVSKPLGESVSRGITVSQLLTHEVDDPALLGEMVEKVARQPVAATLGKDIAEVLGMRATSFAGPDGETNLSDMARFLVAMANEGAFQDRRILKPATLDLMERTHFSFHPAVPGFAYGFAEMRRKGWRALQRDSRAPGLGARIVLVPQARLAYLAVVSGPADPRFWQDLDDGLFNRLLPDGHDQANQQPARPAPSAADAERAAGVYEAVGNPFTSVKQMGRALAVHAAQDGSLILSGFERAVLKPQPGGYWAAGDGNLNAVWMGGRLFLTQATFRPLPLYRRPDLYAWLALLSALSTAAVVHFGKRRAYLGPTEQAAALALSAATVLLVAASGLIWIRLLSAG